MNTRQTPEEIAEQYAKDNVDESTFSGTRDEIKQAFIDGRKSLSTEIERLKQHNVKMMSDNIELIDNFNKLKEKLSGKTLSCPVCDSMAERNKELEEENIEFKEALREILIALQSPAMISTTYFVNYFEQLLSNQNNKK